MLNPIYFFLIYLRYNSNVAYLHGFMLRGGGMEDQETVAIRFRRECTLEI